MTPDISKLQLHELEELQSDIEDLIRKRKYEEWKAKIHTKEEIVNMFTHFGYEVPVGAKIWRVAPRGDKQEGGYGMEVGGYVHSCHIDTTNFKVLLVVSGNDHYFESLGDPWLTQPIIV